VNLPTPEDTFSAVLPEGTVRVYKKNLQPSALPLPPLVGNERLGTGDESLEEAGQKAEAPRCALDTTPSGNHSAATTLAGRERGRDQGLQLHDEHAPTYSTVRVAHDGTTQLLLARPPAYKLPPKGKPLRKRWWRLERENRLA